MSSGFAGSSTRGLSDLDREIEYRLGKGAFDEDFRRPGAQELGPGMDPTKSSQPFEAPQDLAPAGRKALHAAGDPKDQDKMDWLDRQVSAREQGIKPPGDQFPGGPEDDVMMEGEIGPEEFHRRVQERMKKAAGDGAGFDSHATDPAKLVSGTEKADNPDLNDERNAKKELSGGVDEGKWDKAKKAAEDEYGWSKSNPRYWKVVQKIYGNMS